MWDRSGLFEILKFRGLERLRRRERIMLIFTVRPFGNEPKRNQIQCIEFEFEIDWKPEDKIIQLNNETLNIYEILNMYN